MAENITDLAKRLRPFLLSAAQTIIVGGTSAAPSPHDLNSVHHANTLADAQAPQFLKADGTRNLTGNLAVSALATIDGVDLDVFQSTYNTHLGADSHTQYVNNTIARTISAVHTFSPGSASAPFTLGANALGQTVTGLKADQLNKTITAGNGLSGGGALSADRSLAVDQGYAFTWTGLQTFQNTLTARSILPELTDSYDLGSSSKLWRKGWLSEMDAVLFAKNTITLLGGWLLISKNEGAFPADVSSGATTIDFGQAMTVGDFVLCRAAGQVEYIQVGSLTTGTTYDVNRNLDGSGANTWVAGTPYCVLGQNGNGRIELNAYDTPRISILKQGATYNAQTEIIRLGDLNGSYGISSELYGLGIGDYAGGNYIRHDPTNGFLLTSANGNLTVNSSGITLESALSAVRMDMMSYQFSQGGNVIGGLAGFHDASWQYLELASAPSSLGALVVVSADAPNTKSAQIILRASSPSYPTVMLDMFNIPGGDAGFWFVGGGLQVGNGNTPNIPDGYIRLDHTLTAEAIEVTSTAVVTNLNADSVDGAHYSEGTYTPNFTGFTATVPTVTARWQRIGKRLTLTVFSNTQGVSNQTYFTITAPPGIYSANVPTMYWVGTDVICTDNGAFKTTPGYAYIPPNSNVISLFTNQAGAGWTASGNKTASFQFSFETS